MASASSHEKAPSDAAARERKAGDWHRGLVTCANCGGVGHMYRRCNHPVMSYGVICFRRAGGKAEYLLVQRKDTFAFVDFMRGRYDLNNAAYMRSLFCLMTEDEREAVRGLDFDALQRRLCGLRRVRQSAESAAARQKHAALCAGFTLRDERTGALTEVGLAGLLAATRSVRAEPEWGVPKGRRNINESDLRCALREFQEETGIDKRHLQLQSRKPFDETFTGSDGVRYRHVYYLAEMLSDVESRPCAEEVRACDWVTVEQAVERMKEQVERVELLARVEACALRAPPAGSPD